MGKAKILNRISQESSGFSDFETHVYSELNKDEVISNVFVAMEEYRKEQADKILQRLSVLFTDYKNAGFENSAQVTKYIMNEIETLVK